MEQVRKTLADLIIHQGVSWTLAGRMMQTLEQIESQPERYNHRDYGDADCFDFQRHEVKCNSACCFAGHTVAIFADHETLPDIGPDEVASEACRLLNISDGDRVFEFNNFFDFPEHWPDRFKTTEGKVTLLQVRHRVEHFIETGTMW